MKSRFWSFVLASFAVLNGDCPSLADEEAKEKATLEGHTDKVWCVVFNPDGKTLASGSRDGTIRLWDTTIGKCTATLDEKVNQSLHFSPDGKTLATVHGLEVGIWDLASRKRRVLQDEKWMYQCIRFMGSFSPDGKLLATGGLCFPEIALWDVNSGKLLRLLEEKSMEGYRLFTETKFTPDGKTLLAFGTTVGLRKWDVATGKALPNAELPEPYRSPDEAWGLREAAFSPDRKLLAVSIPAEYGKKDGKEVVESPAYVTILDVDRQA